MGATLTTSTLAVLTSPTENAVRVGAARRKNRGSQHSTEHHQVSASPTPAVKTTVTTPPRT